MPVGLRLVSAGGGLTAAAALLVIILTPQAVLAAQTKTQLNILPTVCVIDVVQDGSSQNVQTTTDDCQTLLPELVTPVPIASDLNPSRLPFAGPDEAANRPNPSTTDADAGQQDASVLRTLWSTIASTERGGSAVQQNLRAVSVMAVGVAIVVVIAAVCLDIVLFELRYSRIVIHRLRNRLSRRP